MNNIINILMNINILSNFVAQVQDFYSELKIAKLLIF